MLAKTVTDELMKNKSYVVEISLNQTSGQNGHELITLRCIKLSSGVKPARLPLNPFRSSAIYVYSRAGWFSQNAIVVFCFF